MRTNKSISPENTEKCTTPRDKKISDLSHVLERQRKTIKSLLENQSSDKDVKRNQTYLSKVQPKDKTIKKEPQKYQQLCNQILDIGNRVLNSYRKVSPLQTYRDGNVSIQAKEQKNDTTDKEIQYLKSDDYRFYLQGLAKDGDTGKSDILKRMKQARNNNVYCKSKPGQKIGSDNQILSSARKNFGDYKEVEINRISKGHTPQKLSKNMEMKGWRKENNRILNIFEQNSFSQAGQHNKSMAHSPTMKDLAKPAKIFKNLTLASPKKSVSKNNKIQSKTVECFVLNQPTQQKKSEKPINIKQKDKQFEQNPTLCRHLKQWNLDVLKSESPKKHKTKPNDHQKYSQIYKKRQQPVLRECYSPINVKNKTPTMKFSCTDTKVIYHNQKPDKIVKKSYKDLKLDYQYEKQNDLTDFSKDCLPNIQNINLYELNFKLADPKIKPSYSQSKLVPNKRSSNVTYWQKQKQNYTKMTKNNTNYQKVWQKNPYKQFECKIKHYEQVPIFLSDNVNKRWKLQESQTSSTVTKSAQEQERELKTHSRSKSKLSIVTPSKKEKR